MKRTSWRLIFFAAAAMGAGCVGKVGESHQSVAGGNPTAGGAGSAVSSGTAGTGVSVTGTAGTTTVVITGTGGSGSPGVTFCDNRGVAVTSQVPRLTNAQYDRVVTDLLGVQKLS